MSARVQSLEWLNARIDELERTSAESLEKGTRWATKATEEAECNKPLRDELAESKRQKAEAIADKQAALEHACNWEARVLAVERRKAELQAELHEAKGFAIAAGIRVKTLEDALSKDTTRLDFLERHRVVLNKFCGTDYGWKFIANHNVTRLFVKDITTLDINDLESRGTDIRSAIDVAMQALAAKESK